MVEKGRKQCGQLFRFGSEAVTKTETRKVLVSWVESFD
jgi:hypothetical protein